MREYLTQTEAAKRLGLTKQRLWLLVEQGRIPHVTIAGRRLIPADRCIAPARRPPGRKPKRNR